MISKGIAKRMFVLKAYRIVKNGILFLNFSIRLIIMCIEHKEKVECNGVG